MPIAYEENIQEVSYSIVDVSGKVIATIQTHAISEFNMVYNIFDTANTGTIIFMDNDNIMGITPILSTHKLVVKLVDKHKYSNTQAYSISQISMTLMDNKVYSVKISLIDEYTFAHSQINVAQAFSSASLSDIVTKYNTLINGNILHKKEIKANTRVKQDIIVTQNFSFNDFINRRIKLDSVLLYKNKNSIVICDFDKLLSNFQDMSSVVVFKPDHPVSNSPLKVYDLDISMLDRLTDINTKTSEVTMYFDPLNKSVSKSTKMNNYATKVKKVTSKGVLPNVNDSLGYRTKMKVIGGGIDGNTTVVDADKTPFDIEILSNYIVEITIKGAIQIDIGQIVGLKLLIPGTNIDNKMLTGKWIVSRVSEKIIGNCYVQKLRLITPTIQYTAFAE